MVKKMVGKNAVELLLKGEFDRKHPVFPVSLLKKFNSPEDNKYQRKEEKIDLPMDEEEERIVAKVLRQKRIRDNNQKDVLLYLVR